MRILQYKQQFAINPYHVISCHMNQTTTEGGWHDETPQRGKFTHVSGEGAGYYRCDAHEIHYCHNRDTWIDEWDVRYTKIDYTDDQLRVRRLAELIQQGFEDNKETLGRCDVMVFARPHHLHGKCVFEEVEYHTATRDLGIEIDDNNLPFIYDEASKYARDNGLEELADKVAEYAEIIFS